MRPLKLFRGLYNAVGTAITLLAIPLAFNAGGPECGLSFTLLLSLFHLVLTILRVAFKRTFLRPLASAVYYTQFIVIPSLLLMHLKECPVKSPVLNSLMWPWRAGLDYATGVFTICEGFCTLIIVQFSGRVSAARARKSDSFLLVQMVAASVLITIDVCVLLRIYALPEVVTLASATLIGAALSVCLSLGIYGLWSRRGNVIEVTLLFSYIVYQIYLTVTDFQRATATNKSRPWWSLSEAPNDLLDDIELPPVLVANVVQFMTTLAELTPAGLKTILQFLRAVVGSISPSICMSLAWRMFSYLGALRLVPLFKHQTTLPQDRRQSTQSLGYSLAPVLIIMVYTHLLLQHGGKLVHPQDSEFDWSKIWTNSREAWQFWGWTNVFVVLAFYAIELAMSPVNTDPGAPVATVDDVIEMD